MDQSPIALVVHVLPADAPRGAQVFARDLRRTLDGKPDRHRTLSVFGPALAQGGLQPDVVLGITARVREKRIPSARAVVALGRSLRRLEPDVVVAHGGESLVYAALACSIGTPIVYTRIGASGSRLERLPRLVFWRLISRRPQVVVAVSHDLAEEARSVLRIPSERVSTVFNGRDPEVFRPRAEHGGAKPRLIHVGSLERGKRPERFVSLVGSLRHEALDIDATIVGDGPMMGEVRQAAEHAGVELLGAQADVADLLRAADVLVLTSVMEGMPGVLIEAGLTGIPVVTTAVEGASTVVVDGETGFVVPVDDPNALLEATRRLVQDRALRERMGRAARVHCVDRFGLVAVAQAWQAVLDGVLERPARPDDRSAREGSRTPNSRAAGMESDVG